MDGRREDRGMGINEDKNDGWKEERGEESIKGR